MKIRSWRLRATLIGGIVASLPGCGSIPVPKVLRPIVGAPAVYTDTTLCVVDLSVRRGLRVVEAQKKVGSEELFLRVDGKRRRIAATEADGYARNASWYRGDAAIRQYGRRFIKQGEHRIVPASALTRGADHRGVPVFLDRTDQRDPAVLYVPVEPGCVFQPYMDERYAGRG